MSLVSQLDLNLAIAAPGVRPNSITTSSVTFSNFIVTWDELSCVDRNGELTGYRIEYGTTTIDKMETVTGTSFTATELTPFTTYMFRVAAVYGIGTGPYSTTVNIMTLIPSGKMQI